MTRIRLTAVALLLTGCASSHHPDDHPTNEAGTSNSSQLDASGADVEPVDDSGMAFGDLGDEDASNETGSDLVSPESVDPWLRERACTRGEREISPVSDSPFAIPETPSFDPSFTRSQIIAALGTNYDRFRMLNVPSEHGTYRDTLPYDVFLRPGDDLRIYFHLGTTEGDDEYIITPLLDYQLVEAHFSAMSDDRSVVITEGAGPGFIATTESGLALVDITIASDEFTVGRTHELTLSYVGVDWDGASYRLQVHYGGYEPPPAQPCVPEPLEEEWTDFDRLIRSTVYPTRVAGIFTIPHPSDDPWKVREVTPGENVRIFSTIFRRTQDYGPTPIFLQPTINGRPVGEPWWRSRNGPSPYRNVATVEARDHFDITLPEEPGDYYVALKAIESPWVRWRPFDPSNPPEPGDRIFGVENNGIPEGSNIIHFRVVEPGE